MIRDGEKTGALTPEKTILDATSGNTGIAYAWIGAALGYRVKLCMPKNASEERKKILGAYGVDFVLTAPEIWEQTSGEVTHFVAGLGTSGTFVGTATRLKEYNPGIATISFEPDSAFHGLEGMKHMESAIVPAIYDPAIADQNRAARTEDAYEMVKRVAREEGILIGLSAGAAVATALEVAREIESGTVVTILCDGADKYLSEKFWEE